MNDSQKKKDAFGCTVKKIVSFCDQTYKKSSVGKWSYSYGYNIECKSAQLLHQVFPTRPSKKIHLLVPSRFSLLLILSRRGRPDFFSNVEIYDQLLLRV